MYLVQLRRWLHSLAGGSRRCLPSFDLLEHRSGLPAVAAAACSVQRFRTAQACLTESLLERSVPDDLQELLGSVGPCSGLHGDFLHDLFQLLASAVVVIRFMRLSDSRLEYLDELFFTSSIVISNFSNKFSRFLGLGLKVIF